VPFTAVWFMAVPAKARRNVMANISLTVFGIVYIPVLASHVVVLASFDRGLTVAVLALAFGYDIVAYVGGSLWGEHRLAPTISPGKTREGLILATLLTVLLAVLLLPMANVIEDVWVAVGVAIVAVVAAPIGDLAESLMKRDLGIKDMSSILPGHGGALDRIDSILFVAPAVFYFLLIV
jgi:phosphatidate cytidylyltransferase